MFKLLAFVFGFIGMMLGMVLFNTLLIKIAWVYSVTPLFGVREPGWIEAFALSWLCSALFKAHVTTKS